ncbi:hypothetical protein HHK36_013746 [Tetracentron sinense]|uniref:RING-type domain-containing protein n=1 Tax=Tetracentron sinense TaxID=13715 RepID=A0A834Z8R0_TETSI|nr:hypothetical protein HHK36_013746 [Tetracentron sinense]
MGNRICIRRRSVVEERFTRPRRLLHQPPDVDFKKLRKLIVCEKLAPCFDAVDDSNSDLEECPICFFFFPSLNRSRCCTKGICTECFLQIKPSNASNSTPCPFCKMPSYAVEFRGARTQEEKGLEQAEEQKVVEAKIRMQLQESQNIDHVRLMNQNSSPAEDQSSMSVSSELANDGVQDLEDLELSLAGGGIEVAGSPVNSLSERHEESNLDLEEVMMMEAIWRSVQDTILQKSTTQLSSGSSGMDGSQNENDGPNQNESSFVLVGQEEIQYSDSVTGGLAIAIARLAECNILQSGTSLSTRDYDHGHQTQDENYIVERQSRMLRNTRSGADTLHTDPTMDTEFDETESECGSLLSCSSTSDESWGSFSACQLKGNQCSEDGSISDEDLVTEDDSCLSSVHTISDLSCGSPNHSDIVGSPSYSQLPGTM